MNNLALLEGSIAQPATMFRSFLSYIDARPASLAAYTRALRQYINYLEENEIRQPQREDIIAYREYLKQDHKPATVQLYITAVRLFYRWAAQEGLYKNIADHIKGATISREHKKDYLAASQVKELLNSIDRNSKTGLRDYAIIALMVTGGLRDIEVSRANISDLKTVGSAPALFIQGKGRDEAAEYVKLAAPVDKAIREYLKTRKAQPQEPLFTSESNNSSGQRLTTRSISGIVKAYLKKAGFNSDRITSHSLRHTAVTLSLLGGQTLQETQQFARHSNIATTQIYAHNLDRAANKCELTIAAAIF